jgi:phenylacetate-CoA ligase
MTPGDQLAAIHSLLATILPANRFYRRKLGEQAGPFASLQEFSAQVPCTTKEELAADHEACPPYGTTHTFGLTNYCRFHQTSGTRGRPLVWLDDAAGWSWVLDNWEWVWRGTGATAGDSAFFPFSFGPFLGFWAGFEAAARMGIRTIPGGGFSSEERLRLLRRTGANLLCCTPTYALRLAEVGAAIGLPVGSLGVTKLIVCGEPGGSIPAVRSRIENAWQARVFDHHGLTEIGPVSVSSQADPDLLLLRHEAYFAEVIDPASGRATAPGETGELVLTTLGRAASPLLRYRTGDLVKPVALPGAPPEHFALAGGILGRADDMVVIRGVNVHPSSVDAVVRSLDGIAGYQVEIDRHSAMPEIRLRAETNPATARLLERRLRAALSLRIPVTPVAAGTLPVFEVKARRWIVTA